MTPLTDEQAMTEGQNTYLAEKIMGWHKTNGGLTWHAIGKRGKGAFCGRVDVWSPLTDWNHWRQVEEKVMEDEKLIKAFMAQLVTGTGKASRYWHTHPYLKANLPTRVDALSAAHSLLTHAE